MEKKKVKLGFLGMGIVGSELVAMVMKNLNRIATETGTTVSIEKIYVRSLTKTRETNSYSLPLTTDIEEVINNPAIDIICECMGGNGYLQTNEYIQTAMNNGKHVILSSKKALAHFAEKLLLTAQKNKVHLKYDASVGGGIPIAKILDSAFKGEKIVRIMGIFNATSNFIYTQMANENDSFAQALAKAQEKGYAENDSTEDVDGFDSVNKLAILGLYGMHKLIHPELMVQTSFRNIDVKDMQYASELGFRIKPLAMLIANNGNLEYNAGPCLVPSSHVLANTSLNFNTIVIEGEDSGEYCFYGQGAGAKPTASAMLSDLFTILKSAEHEVQQFTLVEKSQLSVYQSNMYWRFVVKNEVGILAFISNVFADNGINIEKIIQKEKTKQGIEIVLLTSQANLGIVNSILQQLEKQSIVNLAVIPFANFQS